MISTFSPGCAVGVTKPAEAVASDAPGTTGPGFETPVGDSTEGKLVDSDPIVGAIDPGKTIEAVVVTPARIPGRPATELGEIPDGTVTPADAPVNRSVGIPP